VIPLANAKYAIQSPQLMPHGAIKDVFAAFITELPYNCIIKERGYFIFHFGGVLASFENQDEN
jgi:hypothetical protein